MTKTQLTYFDILGISPQAKDEDVRRAYHSLAMRWHPDRNPQNRPAAENALRLLNQAYTYLKTAPQRQAYSRSLVRYQPLSRPMGKPIARNKPLYQFFSYLKEILWPFAPKQKVST